MRAGDKPKPGAVGVSSVISTEIDVVLKPLVNLD